MNSTLGLQHNHHSILRYKGYFKRLYLKYKSFKKFMIDVSYLINVGVPHFGQESEGRWWIWVVNRKFNMRLKRKKNTKNANKWDYRLFVYPMIHCYYTPMMWNSFLLILGIKIAPIYFVSPNVRVIINMFS